MKNSRMTNNSKRECGYRGSIWSGLSSCRWWAFCLLLGCLAWKPAEGATYNETYQMFYTYGDWTYVNPHLDVQYNNIYIDGANRGYWRLSAHAGQYLMLSNGNDYHYLRDSNLGSHGFVWLFINPSSSCYSADVKNTNGKKVNGEGSVCNYDMVFEVGSSMYLSVWQGNLEWNCDNTIYALTSRCFKNDGTQIDGQTQWRASIYSIGDRRNVMTIANGGSENFIGRITGSTRVVKNGGGWQYLTASDNDFSGGLQINGGMMIGCHDGAGYSLGSGTIQLNGGCLHNGNYTPTYSNAISVTATSSIRAGWSKNITLTGQVTGGGRLDIADDSGVVIFTNSGNNWSGGLRIGGAAVENGSGAAYVRMDNNNTIGTGTLSFGSANSWLDTHGYSATITGITSDSGITSAYIQNTGGASTLTLNGDGNYYSYMRITGNIKLKLSNGMHRFRNGSTDFTGGVELAGGYLYGYAGNEAGTGTITVTNTTRVSHLVNNGGAGTPTASESSRPTYGNTINLQLGSSTNFSSDKNYLVIRAGWNSVSGGQETSIGISGNITGTGSILYGSEATPGYVYLSGNNTYNGSTKIGDAAIDASSKYNYWGFIINTNNPFGTGKVTVSKNARWEVNTSSATRTFSNSEVAIESGNTLMLMATNGAHTLQTTGTLREVTGSYGESAGANAFVLGSNLTGAGALRAGKGTVVLTGSNSGHTGTTTIESSTTLQLGNNGTTGTFGTGNVTNNGTVNVNRSNAVTFTQLMGGSSSSIFTSGTFQQIGAGAVTIDRTGLNAGTISTASNDSTVLNLNAAVSVTNVRNQRGTINCNSTLTANSLKTGDYSSYSTSVTNINSGANVTVSGTLNSVSNEVGMIVGHWPSIDFDHYAVLNVNGGTLSMTNSNLEISWDSGGIMNVSGGTLNLKGLFLVDRGASVKYRQFNLTGGTVNLGENGLRYVDVAGSSPYPTYDSSNQKSSSSYNSAGLCWIKLGAGTLGTLTSWSTIANMTLTDSATGTTFSPSSGNTITYGGQFSGSGKLVKAGAGTMEMTGDLTHSIGAVDVTSGLMIISPTSNRDIENGSYFGTATTTVRSGATLRYAGSTWSTPALVPSDLSSEAPLVIDGGTVQVGRGNYFGYLKMKNGALLEQYGDPNQAVRVGLIANSYWKTEGTGNQVTATIYLVRENDYNRFTMDTAANSDVTVGSIQDLTVTYGVDYSGMEMRKTGAGTMTISAASTYVGATVVTGGTLLVSGSGTVGYDASVSARSGNIVMRDGGTLEFAKTAGTTQSITGNMFVGDGTGTSVMKLTSGTITTTSLCADTYVGWSTAGTSALTGRFIQDGGTFNSYHWLNIGEYATGQYDMNDGTLNARMLCVGRRGDGTLNVTGGAVNLVDLSSGSGTVLHIGANWDNMATTGIVEQTGGTVTAPQITYGACSGTSSKENIGRYNLSGGTLVLTGTLTATHDLSSYRRHEMNITGTGQMVLNTTGTVSGLSFSVEGTGDGTGAVLFQRAASINNAVTLTGNTSVGVEDSITGTMSGAISGSGKALTKIGTGTLVLSGSGSTYNGGTTIAAGTLKLGVTNGVTSDTAMAIAAGCTFDLNGFNQTLSMLTGSGSGSGTVTNTKSNTTSTLIVSNATLDTYAGMISESGTGKIRLVKQNTDKLEMKAAVAFSGGLDVTGGTLLFSGAANIDSSVSVTGNSTPIFTNSSVVNGTVNVTNGTLQMGNNTAGGQIGSASVALGDSGTLKLQYLLTRTFSNLVAGSGTIVQNSISTVNLSSDLGSFTGAVSVLKGTLNTTRAFTASNISIAGGTLKNSLVTLTAGSTTISGGTLNLDGGDLVSDVTVTSGTLKLNGSTLTGDVFLRGGNYSLKECTLNGNFIAYEGIAFPILQSGVTINGTIYRGVDSVGTLSTNDAGGAFYFDEGTTLQLTMPSGSQAVEPEELSLVNFSEMAPASSELISVTSLKQLSTGDVVTTDEAVALTKLALNGGMTLNLTVNDRPAATESGWADLLTTTDGIVGDASAFDTLNLNFGANTVSYHGDLSSFLQVNNNSLQINADRLRSEYNTAVPEPSTWLLLVLGVFGLTTYTTRRKALTKRVG